MIVPKREMTENFGYKEIGNFQFILMILIQIYTIFSTLTVFSVITLVFRSNSTWNRKRMRDKEEEEKKTHDKY